MYVNVVCQATETAVPVYMMKIRMEKTLNQSHTDRLDQSPVAVPHLSWNCKRQLSNFAHNCPANEAVNICMQRTNQYIDMVRQMASTFLPTQMEINFHITLVPNNNQLQQVSYLRLTFNGFANSQITYRQHPRGDGIRE